MKKYLSIIALATLAIVGCSKVNLDQSAQDEETPISFKALSYVSQTKADPEHIALPKDAQFDILAYFTDGDIAASGTSKFLYFKDVVSNSVVSDTPTEWIWKTSTTYYWPKTGMLSFYAVYPAEKAGFDTAHPENGFSFEDYAVTVNYAAQAEKGVKEDLMLAQTINQNCNNDTDKHFTDGVALLFHHELAKVKFSAQLYDGKNYDATEKKVKVGDVYFSAVIDEISISNIYGVGTLALNTLNEYEWETTGGKDDSGKIVDMAYTPAIGTAFVEGTAVKNNGLTAKVWTKFEEEYYVLPQALPVTDNDPDADDATITVKFTVYAYDKNGNVISQTSYGSASDTAHPAFTKKLGEFKTTTTSTGDTAIDEWKINTVYNYRFIIDPFEGEIYFDPCMEDWSYVDADPEIIYKDVDK